MKNIKWIEDKSKNYRGNFEPLCFKVDNSKYIFGFTSYMTYKTFKTYARKFANEFNSTSVKILEDYANQKRVSNMDIVYINETFKFRIELDVEEGETRKFKYYEPNEIFTSYQDNGVDFHGYTIYKDGTIVNKHSKTVAIREHNGVYQTKLVVNGERKNFTISRLLYWLFVEKFDYENKDLCITYKDSNGLNISLDNLSLVNRKDLIQGENHKSIVKLTDKQVAEIKALYKGKAGNSQYDKIGLSYKDIAEMYNVTKDQIAQIIKGRTRDKKNYKLK